MLGSLALSTSREQPRSMAYTIGTAISKTDSRKKGTFDLLTEVAR
jgi:hypothetical protein